MVGGARIEFHSPQEVIDSGFGDEWGAHVKKVPGRVYDAIGTVPKNRTLVQGKAGGAATAVAQVVGGARIGR